ncbi:hypothetical protein BHE90_006939 [Fusarium euwallaceae]|uniref:Uncharacterized protein n=1 Tax=Fusarium euwallaceae TaxID=1147111 RepID=A0A430LS59_9HYPO|nr:hypothetical protein BHE90_006939 [Fusarium euwallaceae]
MDEERPSLVWIDTKKNEYEAKPNFHPVLDQLLHIPGNEYIGRGLRQIKGNILRGRPSNPDTIHLWFLDPDMPTRNIKTNQAIHGTVPTLIGDTWGEFIWKGPVVAVMRKGSGFEPRHSTDITLTAYRDAIDYLGYYRDTIGSMIEPGQDDHFSKRVLADRTSKVIGVRINCRRDQATRHEPQMVEVAMPKTHPLFNLEGDDPCDIPLLFGLELVAKAYNSGIYKEDNGPPSDDLKNPLAELLLTTTSVKNGEWAILSDRSDFCLPHSDPRALVTSTGDSPQTVVSEGLQRVRDEDRYLVPQNSNVQEELEKVAGLKKRRDIRKGWFLCGRDYPRNGHLRSNTRRRPGVTTGIATVTTGHS